MAYHVGAAFRRQSVAAEQRSSRPSYDVNAHLNHMVDYQAIYRQLYKPDDQVILLAKAHAPRKKRRAKHLASGGAAAAEPVALFRNEEEPADEPPLMSPERGVTQGLDRTLQFPTPLPNTATHTTQMELFNDEASEN